MKHWMGLLGLAMVMQAGPALAQNSAPKVDITLDTTQIVDTVKWANDAKKLATTWYPKIIEILGADVQKEPLKLKFVFNRHDGVAYSSGDEIVVSLNWIEKHYDDIGLIVHEMTHQVQRYKNNDPGWVTEGLADYVRWWIYEPKSPRSPINFNKAKYSDSYRTTAAFFHYVEVKNPGFVKKLNGVMQNSTYSEDKWKEWTGKTVDENWEAFKEYSRKATKK